MVRSLGNIYFAISKTCNLSCKYCYVSKDNKNQKADNEKAYTAFTSFVHKLVDEKVSVGEIIFHGAEPTMISADTYVKMVDYYRKYFPKIEKLPKFSMQTNGTKLQEFIEKLNPDDFKIGVSLDGWKEYNDSQRGLGVFDKVTENIKNAVKKGFAVNVLTVLSKPLIKDRHKLLTFINDMASIGVHVTLKPIHTNDETLSIFNKDGYLFGKWIAQQNMQHHTQACMSNLCDKHGNNCRFFEFDTDGKVYSCNKAYVIGGDFANWLNESFDQIVAKRVSLYHQRKINPECWSCKYIEKCYSGCPLDRVDGKAVDCYIKRGIFDNE